MSGSPEHRMDRIDRVDRIKRITCRTVVQSQRLMAEKKEQLPADRTEAAVNHRPTQTTL